MYENLFNSLVSTIRGWIQDKIDSIHEHHAETLEARNETEGFRDEAASSASSAATSEANAAGAVDYRVNQLIADAPEAMDTLAELADALGNDPNFATTVSTEIGLRAKTVDVNAALANKADKGAENTAQWAQVSGKPETYPATWADVANKPSTFPPSAHTHPAGDVAGLTFDSTNTAVNNSSVGITGSTSMGATASVSGNYPTAVGYGASAASYGAALGNSASASSSSATSVGRSSSASNTGSTAIGFSSGATQASTTAIGREAKATHASSTAIGYQAQTTKANQVMLGTASEEVTVPGSLVVAGTNIAPWVGTQAQYDALPTKDPGRTYNVIAG